MEFFAEVAPIPGSRVVDYRNSSPRHIRLLGLGGRGAGIVRDVARRGYRNVEVVTGNRSVGWDDIVSDQSDEQINMVVIVCGEGDETLFNPSRGKPGMLVTFVVLRDVELTPTNDAAHIAHMRGLSDLFVTTSDDGYVGDLIDNLAS